MLNSRTVHVLKLEAYVATDPNYLPMTVAKLSSLLCLFVSYTERLVRELNDQGLLSAHRGPGGGYMLQICVDELSAWDIAKCFEDGEAKSENKPSSPESSGFALFKEEFEEIKQHFLQNSPLTEITKLVTRNIFATETDFLAKHFKPLLKNVLPKAPNSVFDLANFMQLRAA
jgi:DNA-binding IscR family transcriptional regulator